MAARKSKKVEYNLLPPDTIIEVVAIKRDKVRKQKIKLSERFTHKKAVGWTYKYYQVGFCSIPENY